VGTTIDGNIRFKSKGLKLELLKEAGSTGVGKEDEDIEVDPEDARKRKRTRSEECGGEISGEVASLNTGVVFGQNSGQVTGEEDLLDID
jgi:hypothetical protein